MDTPVRDFWPLTPRPAVLPLPEPMPRPTRMRPLRAPGLSAISLSFIVSPSGRLVVFDAHQVPYLVDHAAHLGRIDEFAAAMALVQPQADQRATLVFRAADMAAGLGDLDLLAVGHSLLLKPPPRRWSRRGGPEGRRPSCRGGWRPCAAN